jgi:hypothetical protein
MTKQGEASVSARRASMYRKVLAIFDQVPDKFQARQVCELAGIKKIQTEYQVLAKILEQDFKCIQAGYTSHDRHWKKPCSK